MKECISPVDIMNGRASPIIMNFNERFKVGGEFKFIPWIFKTFIVCVW